MKEPIALGRRICGAEALLRIHLEIRPEKHHFTGIYINMLTFPQKEKLCMAFTQCCNQETLYFSHKDALHYLVGPLPDPSHRAIFGSNDLCFPPFSEQVESKSLKLKGYMSFPCAEGARTWGRCASHSHLDKRPYLIFVKDILALIFEMGFYYVAQTGFELPS